MSLKNKIKVLLGLVAGFSLTGVISTLLSFLLLYVFIDILLYPLVPSYIGVYILTLGFSFYMNSKFVFRTGFQLEYLIKYFGIYLSGMLLGAALLELFKIYLPFKPWVLSYMVIPITFVWNFALCYKFLKNNTYER